MIAEMNDKFYLVPYPKPEQYNLEDYNLRWIKEN